MQNDEVLFGDKFLYYVQFICYVGFSKLGTEKSGVVQAGASLLQLLSKHRAWKPRVKIIMCYCRNWHNFTLLCLHRIPNRSLPA